MSNLIPADLERCQGEIESYNAFGLGGPLYQEIRCENKPSVIATEKKPGKDGLIGSMSLCKTCKEEFIKKMGKDFATFKPLRRRRG